MFMQGKAQLTKEDKDARKCIVRNVANDLFSLVQGPRSSYYGVIGIERRKAMNIYPWLTGEFVTDMLQYAIRSEKNNENLKQRYQEGRTLKESLSEQTNKRFSAGSLFKANRVAIDSELLLYMEEKEQESVRLKNVAIEKHTAEFLASKIRAAEVLATGKQPGAMIITELKAIVKWKKRKGDDAIPSSKPLLLQRYLQTVGRLDLTLDQFLEENGVQHV